MLWFARRRHAPRDLFSVIHINDRANVEVDGKFYRSRVEDIDTEGKEIHMAAPVDCGYVVPLRPGRHMTVNVIAGTTVWRFLACVDRIAYQPVPMVILNGCRGAEQVEMRGHQRVREEIPVRYRAQAGANDNAEWLNAVTRDISCAGVLILTRDLSYLGVDDFLLETEIHFRALKKLAGHWRKGRTPDVSAVGIRMSTTDVQGIRVGDQLEVSLTLRGSCTIVAQCVVVWLRCADEGGSSHQEMGVKFQLLPADLRKGLVAHLYRPETGAPVEQTGKAEASKTK